MRKPLFKPSLEMIAFQTNGFGELLTGIVEDFRSEYKKGSIKTEEQASEYLNVISKLVKNQMNMRVDVKFLSKKEDAEECMIYLPNINLNHVLNMGVHIRSYLENKDTDAILKSISKFKEADNWVDTKTVRVNGVFSELQNIIYIGSDVILGTGAMKLTPRESTAIILHELGHAFYYIEYIDRINTTNQMLTAFSNSLLNNMEPGKRKVIFQKAQTILNKTTDVTLPLDVLANAKTTEQTAMVFLSALFDGQRSSVGTEYYDYRSCEALADNFCARHGFGKELVVAVNKGMRDFHKSAIAEIIDDSRTSITGFLMSTLVVTAGLIGANVLMLGMGVFIASMSFFMTHTDQQTDSYSNKLLYNRYDDLRVRYQRIKEQLITRLKTNPNKKEVTGIISDLEDIDAIISRTPEPPVTLITRVFEFFNKERKDARAYVELQRDLEELAANELFVKAAKLNNLKLN